MRDVKFKILAPRYHGEGDKWFYLTLDKLMLAPHIVGHFESEIPLPDTIKATCEYTGLKDKNGVEIYEGDIWEKKYKNSPVTPWIAKVVFDEGQFLSSPVNKSYYIRPLRQDNETIEIIGNIYENKEMIK